MSRDSASRSPGAERAGGAGSPPADAGAGPPLPDPEAGPSPADAGRKPPAVDVLLAPGEASAAALEGRLAVVVDVIRASTSILAALEAGAREVVPVETAAEARAIRREAPRVLLCGERRGLPIEGFDLGNSPLEFRPERVTGRRLVWTTTNGTRALLAAAPAAEVWLGCFRNLGAVARAVLERGSPTVVLCAGRSGRFAMDDALCAGHLVLRLRQAGAQLAEGARAAAALATALGEPTPALLASMEAGRALAELGMGADVACCAILDASGGLPRFRGGRVVLLERTAC